MESLPTCPPAIRDLLHYVRRDARALPQCMSATDAGRSSICSFFASGRSTGSRSRAFLFTAVAEVWNCCPSRRSARRVVVRDQPNHFSPPSSWARHRDSGSTARRARHCSSRMVRGALIASWKSMR
ncbi:hypothetical protein DEO23_14015 [Brachybacterium endophyticum]|uniref:Uncharacterized protein n=1 Tax=Brachybacterium endophyticum TaxID=2182385 RepID=A0A2U2RH40_9MICO|nr:hypothetical protein DEO23_14015 [Brachybacterium endophyticum]